MAHLREISVFRLVRYAMLIVPALDIQDLREWRQLLGPARLKAFKDFANLMNGIDDALEYISTQTLASQTTGQGCDLAPYLKPYFDEDTEKLLGEMERLGMLTKGEAYTFANLMFELIIEENRAIAASHQNDWAAHTRTSTLHVDTNRLYFCLMAHLIKRDATIVSNMDTVTFQDMVSTYPLAAQVAKLLQKLDDYTDWTQDFEERRSRQMAWSNCILSKLRAQHVPDETIVQFITHYREGHGYDKRSPVWFAMQELKQEISDEIRALPKHQRLYNSVMQHYVARDNIGLASEFLR